MKSGVLSSASLRLPLGVLDGPKYPPDELHHLSYTTFIHQKDSTVKANAEMDIFPDLRMFHTEKCSHILTHSRNQLPSEVPCKVWCCVEERMVMDGREREK